MIRYFFGFNVFALLFWALYLLFLKNRNSHQWSRLYLILSILFSALLPVIQLPPALFETAGSIGPPAILNTIAAISIAPNHLNQGFISSDWLLLIYGIISALLLLRFILHYFRLKKFIERHRDSNKADETILLNTGIGPGSFGKYIFFPGEIIEPSILKHEQAHLFYRHYSDQLFFQITFCFCFPVIVFYFIEKESALIREFQADETAAKNKGNYCRLLLQQQFQTGHTFLISSFFHHPIKRRIMMLSKSRRPVRHGLLIGSTIIGITCLFLIQNVSPANAAPRKKTAKAYPFNKVDKTAEFPGGIEAFIGFLKSHIKYPVLKKGAKQPSGQVTYQFLIEPNGQVGAVKILNGIGKKYDEAVIHAIQLSPKWEPAMTGGKPVVSYYTGAIEFTGK